MSLPRLDPPRADVSPPAQNPSDIAAEIQRRTMSAGVAVPSLDFTAEGLRHRKWVLPASTYEDGGVSAEKHYYVVGDNPFSMSFTVHTGRYPSGRRPDARPSGMDVSWHRQSQDGHDGCYALSGGTCDGDGSAFDASAWYTAAPKADDGFVADDAVFAHLRARYREWQG